MIETKTQEPTNDKQSLPEAVHDGGALRTRVIFPPGKCHLVFV